jgi:hypothetical protein
MADQTIENSLSSSEVCEKNDNFNIVYNTIKDTINFGITNPRLFTDDFYWFKEISPKQAQEFINYQYPASYIKRRIENDRIFPLETVELKKFEREHDVEIKEATIHTGLYANEIARRMNALAITMGTDIYFRDNAYQPENEEGQKLLAHELTHVAQFEEKRITPNTTKEELEAEAEIAETQEGYDDNPYLYIPIEGEVYKIRESELGKFASMTADMIEQMIEDERHCLGEEGYLRLLCEYERWLKEAI